MSVQQTFLNGLSPLQRELAQLRDQRRRQFKAGLNDSVLEELRQVNQALSLLHAAAYPVGATDWQPLHQASALSGKNGPNSGTEGAP